MTLLIDIRETRIDCSNRPVSEIFSNLSKSCLYTSDHLSLNLASYTRIRLRKSWDYEEIFLKFSNYNDFNI